MTLKKRPGGVGWEKVFLSPLRATKVALKLDFWGLAGRPGLGIWPHRRLQRVHMCPCRGHPSAGAATAL